MSRKKGNVYKAIARLMTGSVMGQLVFLVSLPVISRLFDASSLSDYAIVYAYTNIIGVSLALKLENLIILDSNNKNTLLPNVLSLSFLLFFLLLTLVIALDFLSSFRYLCVIITTLISSLFFSIFNTMLNYYNACGNYKTISYSRFFRPLFEVLIAFLLYYFNLEYYYSIPLSYMLLCLILLVKEKKHLNIDCLDIFHLLRQGRSVVKYDFPTIFLVSLSSYLPLILLPFLFEEYDVALFLLAFRSSVGPIGIVIQSFGVVIKKELVEANQVGNMYYCFRWWASKLFFISFSILLIIFFFTYWRAFEKILGEEWPDIDLMVLCFLPLIVSKVIANPLSYVFYIKDRLDINLKLQATPLLMVLICSLTTFYLSFSINTFVFLYSMSYFMYYILYFYVSYRLTSLEGGRE
ncbi:hypothetical protein AB6E79_14390 [Vibrio lentus]